ncbi:MAG: right-handed parallel beta-helix repeat-containing protein [Bacteroidota bacterium]
MFSLKLMCLGIFLVFSSCQPEEMSLFVSPGGSDNSPGTLDKPLQSISGARDMVRKLKNESPGNKIIVYFREGVYDVEQTIEFNESDSGNSDNPVIYKNYNDEKVVFSGGKTVPSEAFKPLTEKHVLDKIIDEEAKSKIVQVNLKDLGISNYGTIKQHGFSVAILPAQMELFVNSEPQTLARWPNEGRINIPELIDEGSLPIENDFSGRGGTIRYTDERHNLWHNPDEIWIWGFFKAGYADDNIGIESIDTIKKTIKFKHPHMFGMAKTDREHEWTGRNAGYHVFNVLEEIDMPGEYYIDREKGILYYYPKEDLSKSEIVVSVIEDPLLALEGVSNLVFEGIIFEYGKGMGVYLERGNNNIFRSCIFRNFGTIAVMFGKGVSGVDYPIHEFTGTLTSRTVGNLKAHHYENTDFYNEAGKNHGIISCNIYNTGSGGLVLSGGNRTTLEEGGNYVVNSEFYNVNRRNKTYCAQITLYGVGNKISHCYFHDAPHLAIAIFGNEHLIEYSRFERLVQDIHDAGAIGMGRNPSERGNKIMYNYFAELGSDGFKNTALHLDDGSSKITVHGNIFNRASKMDFGDVVINGGSDNLVSNNIFIEGAHGIWLEDPVIAKTPFYMVNNGLDTGGLYWQRMREDLDITSKVWKDKYPDFANIFEWETPFLKRNRVVRNVFYRTPYMISKHGFDSTRFEIWEKNWITDQDPGFKNINDENFELKDDAPVYTRIPGFEEIPFSEIGLVMNKDRQKIDKMEMF